MHQSVTNGLLVGRRPQTKVYACLRLAAVASRSPRPYTGRRPPGDDGAITPELLEERRVSAH